MSSNFLTRVSPGITYDEIDAAYVGYVRIQKHFHPLSGTAQCRFQVYGDSCCGQRALYPLGLRGIPITNVNNVSLDSSKSI